MDHKWVVELATLDSDRLEIQKEMTRLLHELNNICKINDEDPIEKDNVLSEIQQIEKRYTVVNDILQKNFDLKITIIESFIGMVEADLKAIEYHKNYTNMFKGA